MLIYFTPCLWLSWAVVIENIWPVKPKNNCHLAYVSLLTSVLGQRYFRACSEHFPTGKFSGVGRIEKGYFKIVPEPGTPWAEFQESSGLDWLCLGLWAIQGPTGYPTAKAKIQIQAHRSSEIAACKFFCDLVTELWVQVSSLEAWETELKVCPQAGCPPDPTKKQFPAATVKKLVIWISENFILAKF